jgi:hexokinase
MKVLQRSSMHAIRSIIRLISTRAAALLAAGIHAMWTLRYEAEGHSVTTTPHVSIGCNGSVIELYPDFRARCQSVLDRLTERSGASPGAVGLEIAYESALFGAAVAVGCLEQVEG